MRDATTDQSDVPFTHPSCLMQGSTTLTEGSCLWFTEHNSFSSGPSGLETLHNLTAMTRMSLRVDLRDKDESAFAKYSTFEVAKRNYKLTVGGYSGTAGELSETHLKESRDVPLNVGPFTSLPPLPLRPRSSLFQVILSAITTTGSSPPKTVTRRHSSHAAPCRTEEAGGTKTATRQTSTAFTASTSNTR